MTQTPDFTQMTGLEQMRWAMKNDNGDRPTIGRLLGMRFTQIDPGKVTMELETKPDFSNPLGTTHGGIAATLLDSVMGCSIHTELDVGVSYTTLELKVNYIRSAALDGVKLIAEGTSIHVGRRTATAEGRVVDDNGKLIAHGTTTCMIL